MGMAQGLSNKNDGNSMLGLSSEEGGNNMLGLSTEKGGNSMLGVDRHPLCADEGPLTQAAAA